MKPHEAIDYLQKDLSVSFGDGLATQIMMSARSTAQAPVISLDKAQYTEIVHKVCKDPRVVGMLGELTVREKLVLWEQLVN